jgi:hypothetical protein
MTKTDRKTFQAAYIDPKTNVAKFRMMVDFDDLISGDMEWLNDQVDEYVEDGFMLEDLSYTPMKAYAKAREISIQVVCDATNWLKGRRLKWTRN